MRPLERIDRISDRLEFIARRVNANAVTNALERLRLAFSQLRKWESELKKLREEVPGGEMVLCDEKLDAFVHKQHGKNNSGLGATPATAFGVALEKMRGAALERAHHQHLLNVGDNDYEQVRRITEQLNKASKKLHACRANFNSIVAAATEPSLRDMPILTPEEAKNVDNPLYDFVIHTEQSFECSVWVMMRGVRAYNMRKRANEEIRQTLPCMGALVAALRQQQKDLVALSNSTTAARKAVATKLAFDVSFHLANAEWKFGPVLLRNDVALLSLSQWPPRTLENEHLVML